MDATTIQATMRRIQTAAQLTVQAGKSLVPIDVEDLKTVFLMMGNLTSDCDRADLAVRLAERALDAEKTPLEIVTDLFRERRTVQRLGNKLARLRAKNAKLLEEVKRLTGPRIDWSRYEAFLESEIAEEKAATAKRNAAPTGFEPATNTP